MRARPPYISAAARLPLRGDTPTNPAKRKIQPRFDLLAAAAAMDRGKQPAASPAYPASFEAYFSAMGLGGASSWGQEPQTPRQAQLQQRYATPNSPLMLPQPPPSHGGGGGGQGGVHPLMQQHQMMLAQMRATQLQQQQQTSSYCVGEEGSSTNGYFWPVGNGGVSPAEAAAHAQGSSDYAMLLAADRPMPLAADRILPSAADGSSTDYLSRFANGYANNPFASAAAPAAPRRPEAPRSCTLRANASQYQPIGASSRSAVASPSPPRTRRHPYPHPANNYNPSAAIADYQERLVVMHALRANPEDPLWRGVSRISQGRTPEEIRSDMLRGPMPLQLVFFQESAAHVIRLLDEGAETGVDQYRLSALAAIKSDVHRVMEDREGCQVFMALVRACAEQEDEIHAIIAAAAAASAPPVDGNGKHKTTQLLHVTRQDYGYLLLPHPINLSIYYIASISQTKMLRCLVSWVQGGFSEVADLGGGEVPRLVQAAHRLPRVRARHGSYQRGSTSSRLLQGDELRGFQGN